MSLMKMESAKNLTNANYKYIRLIAPSVITNAYSALVTSEFNIANDKDYILHFKAIVYKDINIKIKFRKNTGEIVGIGEINLNDCEVIQNVNGRNEYHCIFKFLNTFNSTGNILIGVDLNTSFQPNEKILDIREVDLQQGVLLLPYAPGNEEFNNTTTELNSKFELLAEKVKTSVSKVEGSIADSVESISVVKQEVDNLEINFDKNIKNSSGKNFVANSEFASMDLTNWSQWGSGTTPIVWGGNIQSGHEYACKITTSDSNQGLEQQITGLEIDEWYTCSCKVWTENGVQGICVRNAGVWNGEIFEGDNNKWTTIKFTFQAKENTTWIHLGSINSNCVNGVTWFTGIQIRKGTKLLNWIPNSNELYSAHYRFDKDGMKGEFEDGTYASMGRKGFSWFDSANMSHAYHCLMEVGTFNLMQHGNGNWTKVKIQLPNYFRNKYFKAIAFPSGYAVGGTVLDTLTVQVESYDLENATFIIQALGHSQNGEYQNNINISWMATA